MPRTLAILLLLGSTQGHLTAQSDGWSGDEPKQHSRPMPKASNERASQEAEERVSFSATTLTQILHEEPGLLLAVKKAMVRRAYEQGRLLDAADLTDDEVFTRLRDDERLRILATHEIEERNYVRAKPTIGELAQRNDGSIVVNKRVAVAADASVSERGNQETQYWSTHEVLPAMEPQSGMPQTIQEDIPSAPLSPRQRPLMSGFEAAPADSFSLPPPTPQATPSPSMLRAAENPELLKANLKEEAAAGGMPPGASMTMPDALSMSWPNPVEQSRMGEGLNASGGGGDYSSWRSSNQYSWPPYSSTPYSSSQYSSARYSSPQYASAGYSSDDEARADTLRIRHQPNPYAEVPSLFDLYQQVSKRSPVLRRFGAEVFENGTGNFDQLPMDTPVGPDYVLGPGDGLNIDIWGSASGHLRLAVDRQGLIAIPEAGTVMVAGKSLADAQQSVETALRSQYREARAGLSLSRLRTVRIYVVGDVLRPGAYEVSSLSTAMNALYVAGGPTSRGSLRSLAHYRGSQLLENVDLYALLLRGVRPHSAPLEAGDTIEVPPLGAEISVEGMVRRPAIYEINGETSLAEVLELSGGVLSSGTLRHIEVERIVAHQSRTMLRLDLPESNDDGQVNQALADFKVQDGDKIRIAPILPYSEKTIYLEGHVFHPGKYAFREGMRITDLIRSYNDLLPEPAAHHAEVIRLNPPDYSPQVIAFDLESAMAGAGQAQPGTAKQGMPEQGMAEQIKQDDFELKPFDTVRIFGRFDFEGPPVITVSGEVRDPGDHLTSGKVRLRDAIFSAGGPTPDAELSTAQVFRKSSDGKLRVISVDLDKAMAGDTDDNVALEPRDRIVVHKDLAKADPAAVKIEGQVEQPGKYPLGTNMTIADLVALAGGLKRSAYTDSADLTRYDAQQGSKLAALHLAVPLARALAGDGEANLKVRDGDVLTIRERDGWSDIGATITLRGEVVHPGTYGIQQGERLSSIVKRAGGFRPGAYPYGIVFERVQVRDIEESNREQLIREVEADGSNLSLIQDNGSDQKLAKEAAIDQWHTALQKLQEVPPSGRLAIHITKEMKRWENTPADIEVRAGDVVYVPKQPDFVMVEGSVYNATAVAYKPGKDAAWYLQQAGGPTNMANKKAIFVIRADGFVAGGMGGLLGGGALRTGLEPGDLVMVPEKAYSGTTKWKTTLESAQLAYAVGIAIQVGRTF